MKEFVTELAKQFIELNIKHEIHSFDSGAFMIDCWIGEKFYCIQLHKEEIGLSLITKDTLLFDMAPDFQFNNLSGLKTEIIKILMEQHQN